MFRRLVLVLVVIAYGLSPARAWAADTKRSARTEPGRQAVETVLRAEVAGQTDRRRQLAAALEQQPNSTLARWQAGYVRDGQSWRSFDDAVSNAVESRASVDRYLTRRAEAPRTSEGQLDLATWCGKQGLLEQERAHLHASLSFGSGAPDPVVLQRLGFRQIGNQWFSPEQLEDWQQRQRAADAAVKKWASRLERIASRLAGTKSQRGAALAELRKLDDPSVVPALEYCLAGLNEEAGLAAVETLKRMEGPAASLALANQGLFSNWPPVRKLAATALKGRRLDEFVPGVIGLLAAPAQGEWRLIHDATRGTLSYSYAVAVETEDLFQVATLRITNQVVNAMTGTAPDMDAILNNSRVWGMPTAAARVRADADALRSVADSVYAHEVRQQARHDRIHELNARIVGILAEISGRDPSPEARQWWQWWSDQCDSQTTSAKPSLLTSDETEDYVTVFEPYQVPEAPALPSTRLECFIAGTQVWTDRGLQAIEKLQTGDRVLSKSLETGELAYKPVLQTTVRPVKSLTKLRVGDETLVCTGGHRFWHSGFGWVKAREIEPQMLLHTATGSVPVWSAKTGPAAETYNLVVADFHTYFVGKTGILSQDLLIPRGTDRIVPGLPRVHVASLATK